MTFGVQTSQYSNGSQWFDGSHILDDPGQKIDLKIGLSHSYQVGYNLCRWRAEQINVSAQRGSFDSCIKDSDLCQKLSTKKVLYKKHGHVFISEYSNSGYVGDKGDRKSTEYCTFVGGNLVTWRRKK